ncbi:MAG: DUF6049 family protein [Acidimicrobiales bacterium]
MALVAAAVVLAGLVIATGASATTRGPATSRDPAASLAPGTSAARPEAQPVATSGPSPPLTLSAQTSFVAPGQPFDVKVRPGGGSPPIPDLGLTVAVYACLSSVSAFDQSVSSASGPPGTRISSSRTPVPLSALPVSGGAYDLSMPVTVGESAAATSVGGFAIDLTAAGAQCGAYPSGVYPVRIDLVDTAGGQTIGGLTTHLVYVDPPAGTEKLRVALVLPLQTTLRPAVAPAPGELRDRPSAALAPPAAATVDAVTGTVNLIATQHASVPLTLEASPQTVTLLNSTGHQATVAQLASLAATPPGTHQIAASPYVPVDASSLVDAGLSGELGQQVGQGVGVLDSLVTHAPAPAAGTARPLGPWFTDAALDPATLAQLQVEGYDQLVLPAGTVSAPPTNGSAAEPFALATAKGTSMTALAFSADLSSRFTGAPADPVLAAHQLVAELAQMYYEKPNDTTVRGVPAVAPGGWSDSPAFVDALLGALQASPILQPVTTTTMFDALGSATNCRGGCRLGPTAGSNGLPATAIRTQRQRVNGLSAAAPVARPVADQLSEVLLSGQSEDLRAGQQTRVVANAATAISAQLAQIAVAGDRTITLTSQRGRVPVTIVSAAPYPVDALLTLTSDKLLFANHSTTMTQPVTLTPAHTNVVYVAVQTRASGLFKVDIVLRAPAGRVVLSIGQISVRSTATSVVGIVLSLGAVAVLAAWWIRTSRKRRRARRAEAPVEVPAEPVATG